MAFALGNSSRPLIPGILMSDKIKISEAAPAPLMHCNAAEEIVQIQVNGPIADRAEMLAKQHLDVRFVIDHKNKKFTRVLQPAPKRCCTARQNDLEFCEFTRLRIDFNRPAMLLDDDVMAYR